MATVFGIDQIQIGPLRLAEGDRVSFIQGDRLIDATFENASALQGDELDAIRNELPEHLQGAQAVIELHVATPTEAHVLHLDEADTECRVIWRQPSDDLHIHGLRLSAGYVRINDTVRVERPGKDAVTFTVAQIAQIAQIETDATLRQAPEGWRVPGVYRLSGSGKVVWLRSDEEATITNLSDDDRRTQNAAPSVPAEF